MHKEFYLKSTMKQCARQQREQSSAGPKSLFSSLRKLGSGTFWREALRESLWISTIVVNHVILLYPFHSLLACRIQLLREPIIVVGDICIEVPIRSCEGGMRPVGLNKTTPCCPIISIPETRVDSHWLVLWEWNTQWFWVLELSDRSSIYWENNALGVP